MMEENKEEKIISKIEKITGIKPKKTAETIFEKSEKLRSYKINKILIFSSSYDYFLLEEGGRLNHLFAELYSHSSDINPPQISHVETEQGVIDLLSNEDFDLIIIFNKPPNTETLNFAEQIKKISTAELVVLANDVADINALSKKDRNGLITEFFTWNGDGKIILSIVQLIEDSINADNADAKEKVRPIILIEDSIQHYSNYITLIYDEIKSFLNDIISNELNQKQKQNRIDRRPFLLHAKDLQRAEKLIEQHKETIVCVITDNHLYKGDERIKNAGIKIAKQISREKLDFPVLIQSSEPIEQHHFHKTNIDFLSKNSADLTRRFNVFLQSSLSPRFIEIRKNKSEKKQVIKNLDELQHLLLHSDDSLVFDLAQQRIFSSWLEVLGEYELADSFSSYEKTVSEVEKLRKNLLEVVEDYRYSLNQAAIQRFERLEDSDSTKISRIGDGALGGKARGLAFLTTILSKYVSDDMFPGLRITVPRSIVLSTDIFDLFLEQNDLLTDGLFDLPDERIASKFMNASLPATIIGDLRAFIRNTRKPLIIRSSGVLEDSLLQPFAGIYASMLLPNESWETDLRFQEVCNAIKYIYASTFFEKARNYIRSTPKSISDEKMGVLIQEVIGERHGTFFYPAVSGVAKSYNYYPSGPCKPDEGIVYLALGLGKAIVDGGSTYCFCPERPKAPLAGTPKDFIRYSQTEFYALNLRSIYRIVNKNEDTSLEKLGLDVAKNHRVLDHLVSTYDPKNDRLSPGLSDDGYLVLDFSPIVKYNEIPLAKALKLLLNVCEIALGYPVEIEFALNFLNDQKPRAELVILQIRNMMPPGDAPSISTDDFKANDVICYSENALGNGIISDIRDIVFVKSQSYDMSDSNKVATQIKKINSKLMDEKTPYVLAGPGRWGSADPWLGIPVVWSDIAGAKVIIETPFKKRPIDFSQGSHFFHDMISSNVAYLKTEKGEGNLDWDMLNSMEVVEEIGEVKHVKAPYPLTVVVDGKNGKAIIQKGKADTT